MKLISASLCSLALGIGLGACGDTQDQPAVQQRVELKAFGSCGELRDYIERTAVRQMQTALDNSLARELRRHTQQGGGADAGVALPAPTMPAPEGPADHTETNTQVQGVDEPDFVKNDGKRIFVLSGEMLYAATSWPPQALATTGELRVSGQAREMFLVDDQIVIFSEATKRRPNTCYWQFASNCRDGGTTKVTLVDVSELSAPRVVRELVYPGKYHGARRVGNAMRLVLRDQPRWPEGLQESLKREVYDAFPHNEVPRSVLETAYGKLKRRNELLIRGRSLDSWIPGASHGEGDGATKTLSYACGEFLHPTGPTRLGLMSVVSINLQDLTAKPHRLSVLAAAGTIYASKSSLYINSPHWWWWPSDGQKDYSYLHKFDISGTKPAQYVASGTIDGHLLNQFSLDEHEGNLRVATTIVTPDPDPEDGWRNLTTNRVSVLREAGGRLEVIGQTADLADGERIFAVRFQRERGYVVTFRMVDPLYTLDLSDPRNPRVIGELKVPGFSTYIHPLGRAHLLTIGVATEAGGGWWGSQQMKLTVFDISDFAKPKEKFTQLVGTAYGWSEAAYEHKAFNFFSQRGLLAIPFSDYGWGYSTNSEYWESFVSEVRLFEIDAEKGITARGALSFKDIFSTRDNYSWHQYYSPWVRRSVMAVDTAGIDYVYAITDAGIRVAKLSALDAPLATAIFARP